MAIKWAVSNSEIGEWQNCELAWLYKYHPESKIQRKDFGPARTRGILIHELLEEFYKGIKNGLTVREATKPVIAMIDAYQAKALADASADKMEMIRKVRVIFMKYFEVYEKDIENWEIISTENFHMMSAEPTDKFYIAMRIDMVIYQHYGKYAGEISPVDHKSTNDWWSQANFLLNSQMPMYLRSLRQATFEGHPRAPIRRAIMNFIRTRDMADPAPFELLMRSFIVPKPKTIEIVYENFLKIARRIVTLKNMEFADAKEYVTMHLGTNSCKFCDFKNICMVTIEDGDPRLVIGAEYERTSYGYPPLEMIDDGTG